MLTQYVCSDLELGGITGLLPFNLTKYLKGHSMFIGIETRENNLEEITTDYYYKYQRNMADHIS